MKWHLDNMAVEVRYSDEFLYWDKTGLIAKELVGILPSFALVRASPSETNLASAKMGFTCRYSYKVLNLIQDCSFIDNPVLYKLAAPICALIFDTIQVTNIARLGNRLTYHCCFETVEEAAEQFRRITEGKDLGCNFLSTSEDPRLQSMSLNEISLNFKGDKLGVRLNIKTGKQVFNINGVVPEELRRHIPEDKAILILDIDVFTISGMSVEGLAVDEFLKSNTKLVETRIFPLVEV